MEHWILAEMERHKRGVTNDIFLTIGSNYQSPKNISLITFH